MRRGGVLPVRSYQPETYKIKQTMIISALASAVDQSTDARLNPSMKGKTRQANARKRPSKKFCHPHQFGNQQHNWELIVIILMSSNHQHFRFCQIFDHLWKVAWCFSKGGGKRSCSGTCSVSLVIGVKIIKYIVVLLIVVDC